MKIIKAKEIELFKNLTQIELDNLFYDFHNDFDCIQVLFESNMLILLFKNIMKGDFVSFKFDNATIESFDSLNFEELKNLTVDNIYRGRFQKNDQLFEFDINGKSYFYIEFYEGPSIELKCMNIIIAEADE